MTSRVQRRRHGHQDNQRRALAAAHAALTDAVAKVATSEDWQQLLRISGSFHRYSPNNQLLLAAQGAQGAVASFHTWKQIPATDGNVCRIRKGETALRVYAPIRAKRRELDPDSGEISEPSVIGFRARSCLPRRSARRWPGSASATEAARWR